MKYFILVDMQVYKRLIAKIPENNNTIEVGNIILYKKINPEDYKRWILSKVK